MSGDTAWEGFPGLFGFIASIEVGIPPQFQFIREFPDLMGRAKHLSQDVVIPPDRFAAKATFGFREG